ncbi:MAG: hypothetical protein HUU14_10810 [Dehalococcoidia bacterium]|nr:hypothetical protein [Chloroflexi bacterium CFX7]MCK6565478.1 hypothetical protein [Dehalococcoidia bacterium]NUQ56365.1 hypothetical protein [Dehalococcoidia bacterium]
MSHSTTTVQVPQEARDRARGLGWEDGLIELALEQGHSLQEVWQALRGGVDGARARQFLAGGGFTRPDPWWMSVPTEWGIRARPADPELGLSIQDLMVGTYGDVPDVWTNRTEIARGSFPAAVGEDMGYTIFDKAIVWADCCIPLYEVAIRDRWISATDLDWASLTPLPADREKAVCQLMTELSERAYLEGAILSGWLPAISYGYLELKLFLSTVIYDLARHAETFRKRALANGGGLGLQAPTDYSRTVAESRSYVELMATLFVQDSMLLTLYESGDLIAQNELEREMYRLCARDRKRYMAYHVERMKHFLFKVPDRREEQQLYLNRAEAKLNRDWNDPAVSEPLTLLLAGERGNMDEGRRRLQELRKRQVAAYLANLQESTITRKNLNGRFQDILNS